MYLTNDVGDVYARREDGDVLPVEPEDFGWAGRAGRNTPAVRRSLDQLQSLPGFSVTVEPERRFLPGPRPRRPVPWMAWDEGAAPPAAALSKGGYQDPGQEPSGTLAYCDRLSDAFGLIAWRLPGNPERSPFVVHDFVQGRRFTITYRPAPLQPGGEGTVYILDDGHAFKIGITHGHVAARVAGLQTGNPRLINTVVTVSPATQAVEAHLHAVFGRWSLRGEWFDRRALLDLANAAGGWQALLRESLPEGQWTVSVLPPLPSSETAP